MNESHFQKKRKTNKLIKTLPFYRSTDKFLCRGNLEVLTVEECVQVLDATRDVREFLMIECNENVLNQLRRSQRFQSRKTK